MIYLNQKKNQQIIIMEIKEELSLEDIDKLLLQEEELNLTSDIKQQINTVSIPVSGLWLNGRLKKKTWKNYNTI